MSMVKALADQHIFPAPAISLPARSRTRFAHDASGNAWPKSEDVKLADGRTLQLRPIRADDVGAVCRCFTRLDPDEIHMRFMQAMREIPMPLAQRLCALDPLHAVAFVLMDESCSPAELRGVGRLHVDATTRGAEFALLVERAWTGHGLGRLLMLHLIAECRRHGVEELWGHILIDNRPMLDLCRELGFQCRTLSDDPGLQLMTLTLDATT